MTSKVWNPFVSNNNWQWANRRNELNGKWMKQWTKCGDNMKRIAFVHIIFIAYTHFEFMIRYKWIAIAFATWGILSQTKTTFEWAAMKQKLENCSRKKSYARACVSLICLNLVRQTHILSFFRCRLFFVGVDKTTLRSFSISYKNDNLLSMTSATFDCVNAGNDDDVIAHRPNTQADRQMSPVIDEKYHFLVVFRTPKLWR